MAKIILSPVTNILGNPAGAAAVINNNNERVMEIFERVLMRDGTAPNQLTENLDVNNYALLNVGRVDFKDFTAGGDSFLQMIDQVESMIDSTQGQLQEATQLVNQAEQTVTDAEGWANLAERWANEDENVPVESNRYSSLHWAKKAQEAASSGIAGVSSWNGRTGDVVAQIGDYTAEQITDLEDYIKDVIDSVGTLPLGYIFAFPGDPAYLDDGFDELSGQEVLRANYPEYWAKIESGALGEVISETAWQADPYARLAFSEGDGSTTFRFPDYNGIQSGSIPGLFLRGYGKAGVGAIQGDAIRNITGNFSKRGDNVAPLTTQGSNPATSGAFGYVSSGTSGSVVQGIGTFPQAELTFDASNVVPTADENRPVNASIVWVARTRGATATPLTPSDAATLGANVFSGAQKMLSLEADTATINGSLEADSAVVNGAVQAEEFIGDGSQLTNLPISGVGIGQTWQNVKSSRSLGTTYQNTTGKPILVCVYMLTTAQNHRFQVSTNGSSWTSLNLPPASTTLYSPISVIIPNGHYYKVDSVGSGVSVWVELR